MTTNPQFSQARAQTHALCSLSTALRALGVVNVALCFSLLLVATGWNDALARFFVVALWLEPACLLSTAAFCGLMRRGWAGGLNFACASAAICFALAACSQLLHRGFGAGPSVQAACVGGLLGAGAWFLLQRQSTLASPALQEADLRILGAAMRPHFFFNALNAVMGLIRVDPRRAEDMLQDTAELFRDVMAQDQRRLVTLEAELDTAQRYARIEQARLAERLRIEWAIDAALMGAVLPPFTLQLLVENAIRHGIEPLLAGGLVQVKVGLQDQQLQVQVSNPVGKLAALSAQGTRSPSHNGVALANLRQRLELLYDQSASLSCIQVGQHYDATVMLPLEFEA